MILEDFSNKDIIDILDSEDIIENIITDIKKEKPKENIDFTVDNNNNLVISLNLTKNIIKNIKKNSLVKLEFQLSKEFYLSILNDFK
tara:strand:- start:36 stop:296 length:261 start_codon:yes stop_codon:yes gene_type:complete